MTDERSADIDLSTAHRLLAEPARRAVVSELRDRQSGQATVSSLAHSLPGHLSTGDAKPDLVLHHTHLPKLDDAGIVEYDPDRQVVSYSGDPLLERLMAVTPNDCGGANGR